MSTLCETPATSSNLSERLKSVLSRVVEAWKRSQQARADRHLDIYYRRTREARERFLSRATDHYELERFEQAWERRREELWRIY